jgi:hypothetical protein
MAEKGHTKPKASDQSPAKSKPERRQNKEVLLVFNNMSYRILESMQELGGFPSAPATIHMALRILRALQEEALEGYSDVVVQHPFTGDQRIIDIPIVQAQPNRK